VSEMEQDQRLEDIVDSAVERLLDGEPIEAILASHPEHAGVLAPVLTSAEFLVSVPAYDAAPAQRAQAMRRMLDQVEISALGAGVVGTGSGGGIMSIFKSFRGRPLAFQGAAVAGALVLFGALGLGASAATGNAPEPVRELLGISSNSTIRIELEGTIVTVEPSTSTLTVSANGDVRTVIVTGNTELSRGGDAIALGDLTAGHRVEVNGALQPDNSIIATRVHLEDDDNNGFPNVAPSTPGADAPTPAFDDDDGDDRDDDRDDDRGDDDFDDDRSGPNGGDDDGQDDDSDDDGFDDDSSGPGSGDDDDDAFDDDDSGHGGDDGADDSDDDDDGDDDRSGPGGGDDDGDDD